MTPAQFVTRSALAASTAAALVIGLMFGICALVYQGVDYTIRIEHNQPD